MRFGLYLVREGILRPDQFVVALEKQLAESAPLGTLALQAGKLNMRQVFEILAEQDDCKDRFGEVAVRLGFLTEYEVSNLLAQQVLQLRPLKEVLMTEGVLDARTVEFEHERYLEECHQRRDAFLDYDSQFDSKITNTLKESSQRKSPAKTKSKRKTVRRTKKKTTAKTA